MPAYFPFLLGSHIILAVSLVLPSILLPFTLRTRRATVESENGMVRSLLWAQTHGTLAIGIGLALTGIGLVLTIGSGLFQQPWLLVVVFLMTMIPLYGLGMLFASLFLMWGREANHLAELLQEPIYFLGGVNFPVAALPGLLVGAVMGVVFIVGARIALKHLEHLARREGRLTLRWQ